MSPKGLWFQLVLWKLCLEVPSAGMGAAGESQGQCCAWDLHCLNPVSYGMSSANQAGSAMSGVDVVTETHGGGDQVQHSVPLTFFLLSEDGSSSLHFLTSPFVLASAVLATFCRLGLLADLLLRQTFCSGFLQQQLSASAGVGRFLTGTCTQLRFPSHL